MYVLFTSKRRRKGVFMNTNRVPSGICFLLSFFFIQSAWSSQTQTNNTEEFLYNAYSQPVGLFRIELKGHEQILLTTPFRSETPSIQAIIGNQLSDAREGTEADRVLKWDAVEQVYKQALKSGSGWAADPDSQERSDLTLFPGEGFVLDNRQSVSQVVFLKGEVVLDDECQLIMYPALNLFGYPYSTAVSLDQMALGQGLANSEVQIIDPATNKPVFGKGYWLVQKGDEPLLWTEKRPYAGVFPTNHQPLNISAINMSPEKDSATLVIQCSGNDNETIDVYYQDVDPNEPFTSLTGWRIAAENLPTKGEQTLEWTDQGSTERAAPDKICVRYYLAGNANIDLNGDGIPDIRDLILNGKEAIITNLQQHTCTAAVFGNNNGVEYPVVEDEDNTSPTGNIIYVNNATGNDSNDGLLHVKSGAHGPKKSIGAAVKQAVDGDKIVIAGGLYNESLNLGSANIVIVPDNGVILK